MPSFAGVLVVGVARDANNIANLLDAIVGVTLEGERCLALLLIKGYSRDTCKNRK
jgi:hypothetical protein